MSLEVAELNDYVRERTIDWLLGMQTSGFFDGFDEETMNFEELSDDEIEYYFVEWYFTESDEVELIIERNRILQNERMNKH